MSARNPPATGDVTVHFTAIHVVCGDKVEIYMDQKQDMLFFNK